MKYWCLIFLATIFSLLQSGHLYFIEEWFNNRIVNGTAIEIHKVPYQVSLQQFSKKNHFCGGSIISPNIVVSAAHCFRMVKANDIRIRLGSSNNNHSGELVKVEKLLVHEKFAESGFSYDVALLKLATPVRRSSNLQFIELARNLPPKGAELLISGWGTTCHLGCNQTQTLMGVHVAYIDRETCGSSQYEYGNMIDETMICAYTIYKDSCQGDSGGPLVYNNQLVGIVSWGKGCANVGHPGVYTDVTVVRGWILRNAKELNGQ